MSEDSKPAATEQPRPGEASAKAEAAFNERLYASWWTWPLPLTVAALLAAEVHMGYPGIRAWLPYLVLIPLAIAVLVWLSRTMVRVCGDELRVGDARLPLRFVGDAEVIAPSQKQRALGPELDPAAFIVHRPWVRPAVRVWLEDENDPTPYWVVSTRRPERLVAALGEQAAAETARPRHNPS